MAERITAKMDNKVSLTDEQKTKVYQINLDMLSENKAIMENKNEKSQKAKNNKSMEKMKEEWAEFISILTGEQLESIKHFKNIENRLG